MVQLLKNVIVITQCSDHSSGFLPSSSFWPGLVLTKVTFLDPPMLSLSLFLLLPHYNYKGHKTRIFFSWFSLSLSFFLKILLHTPTPINMEGVLESLCPSVLCHRVHASDHVRMIYLEPLNHFYQTWYGGVLSWGDVSCRKMSSLSSMSRSQQGLI